MTAQVGIDVLAHDLASIVEAKKHGPEAGFRGSVRVIDGGELTIVQQKTVASSVSIDVPAHDLTPVVEAEGQGSGTGSRAGIGVIDLVVKTPLSRTKPWPVAPASR